MKKIITIVLVIINIVAILFFLVYKNQKPPVKYVTVKSMFCKVIKDDSKHLKDEYIYLDEYGQVTKIIQNKINKYSNTKEYEKALKEFQDTFKNESSITITGDKESKTIEINQSSTLQTYVTLHSLMNIMKDNYECEIYEYE